jgi:hypothetical protein
MADPLNAVKQIAGAVADAGRKIGGVISDVVGDVPVEVQDGEKHYKASLEEQKAYHPTWFKNIAYFVGQQWVEWSTEINWLEQTAAPSWRVRLTANLILPNVRTAIAKLLKNNPRVFGMPASNDDKARSAARIASRVFEGEFHEHQFQNRLIRLAHWFKMCGSSYLWPLWDSSRGRQWSEAQLDEAGQPVLDPETQQPVLKTYTMGKLVYELTAGFDTLLQPSGPEDFEEHRRIMRVKLMDVEEISDIWGVDVPAEDFKSETSFQQRVLSLVDAMGNRRISAAGESSYMRNKALVKEYFELPSRKFPNGRHFIYSNGRVLVSTEDLDYWLNGERVLPVAKFDDLFIPGRAQGMSMIEQISPLNIQFNKMNSNCVENCNLMSRPKVLSPVGSLEDDVFTTEPGEIVEFTPVGGLKPEPYTPPEMPQYFFTMRDSLPVLIEEITSIHEVSKGRLPRRANSGVAINALQEADDTQVGLNIKNFNAGLTRAFSIALNIMQRKYPEQRISKMIGPSREIDVLAFKGADLSDCDTVRVVIDHELSRSEKIDVATTLMESKMITVEQFLQIAELGDLNIVFDQNASESQYATFENLQMAKGILQPVGPAENHKLHASIHDQFLNSPAGQKLPPEAKQIIWQHRQQHVAAETAAVQGPAGQTALPAPPSPAPAGSPA